MAKKPTGKKPAKKRTKKGEATPPADGAPFAVIAGGKHDPSPGVTKSGIVPPEEQAAARERLALASALDDIDKAILAIVLAQPKTSDREIGAAVGLARETVNRRRHRPAFKAALDRYRADALEIFRSNQTRAAIRLGELIDSKDEDIAARASIEHLKPLLKTDDAGGESGAEAFAAFLEEAYQHRQSKKAPDPTPAKKAAGHK